MSAFLKLSIILAVVFWGLVCSATKNPPYSYSLSDDSDIKEAILDYVEGVYDADTARIHKSVHPGLVKRGTSFNRQKGKYSEFREMNFEQLVDLTETWNKDGLQADANSIKEIVVYDIQDKTAAAKVTAVWGTDHFHLAKIEGKWWIMNVLWQSHQPKK